MKAASAVFLVTALWRGALGEPGATKRLTWPSELNFTFA
jgi:hypothetical protein